MIKLKNILFLFIGLIFFNSCVDVPKKEQEIIMPNDNQSADMNKMWIKEEHQLINKFIERNGWEVSETGTGLRYLIYEHGTGKKAETGMRAMISYSISLLDGTECYSTEKYGPQPFLIEHDDVESGLHEGISYLKVGDRAKLIIPSYLAHGLAGDLNKIPTLATIIYDIRLLGISE
jgi:FKBP-type peptidyl-prolyl cis-trans isomerase FkpA